MCLMYIGLKLKKKDYINTIVHCCIKIVLVSEKMLRIWKRISSSSHCSQLTPINRASQTHLYRAISSTHVPSTHGELAHSLISGVKKHMAVYITSAVLRLFGIIHSWLAHFEGTGGSLLSFLLFSVFIGSIHNMAFKP